MKNAIYFVLLALAGWGCGQHPSNMETAAENPPAEGFNLVGSDPAAIELADSIVLAIGGRKNWDNTRYISWNFFGRRNLVWDKQGQRVRIESLPDSVIYLVDLKTMDGRVKVKGQELVEPDTLKKMLNRAKSIWINDSYWLVMPFKLKDSGVTLKYLGEDTLSSSQRFNVLQMNFENVGDTPQNKYKLYVDIREKLIRYWSYYAKADQDSASFTRPWDNYKQYGSILLSADRSDGGGPKNVKVDEHLPDDIFTEFQ